MIRCALFFLPWLFAVSVSALAGEIAHTVRPGDTPVAVAKIYHVSVAAILARNKGLDPCRIKVGDILFVPRAQPTPGEATPPRPTGDRNAILPDEEVPGVRYVVVPGDCPAGIAERFGIPLETLSRANPGLDPKNLTVGRVLSIPQDTTACAPPPAVPISRPGEATMTAPLVTDFE